MVSCKNHSSSIRRWHNRISKALESAVDELNRVSIKICSSSLSNPPFTPSDDEASLRGLGSEFKALSDNITVAIQGLCAKGRSDV